MKEQNDVTLKYISLVCLRLSNGEVIKGYIEDSGDDNRIKIRNKEGVQWIPYEEITSIISI